MSRLTRTTCVAVAAAVVIATPALADASGHDRRGRCASAGAAEWPMANHDLAGSRNQPDAVFDASNIGQVHPRWSINIGKTFGDPDADNTVSTSAPVVSGSCAFVTLMDGWVGAVDLATGGLVWARRLVPHATANLGGALPGSVTVTNGVAYVLGNRTDGNGRTGPFAAALDAADGTLLWQTDALDDQVQSDTYDEGIERDVCPATGACAPTTSYAFTDASPVVWKHLVLAGWSEPEEADARGGYTLLDSRSGEIVAQHYLISDSDYAAGFRGSGIWATAAVDQAGFAYVGTADPSTPAPGHPQAQEHAYADAIVKIDLNPGRRFGDVVGAYKGTSESYGTPADKQPACDALGDRRDLRVNGQGFVPFDGNAACAQADYDFGASPNLFTVDGRQVVGELQKSGVYHAAYTDTMTTAFDTVLGAPAATGGNTAYDAGTGRVVGSTQTHGFSVDVASAVAGSPAPWHAFTPDPDALPRFQGTTVSHGLVFIPDSHATWTVYDEESRLMLLRRSAAVDYLAAHPADAQAGYAPIYTYGSYGVTVVGDTILVPNTIGKNQAVPQASGTPTAVLVAYGLGG